MRVGYIHGAGAWGAQGCMHTPCRVVFTHMCVCKTMDCSTHSFVSHHLIQGTDTVDILFVRKAGRPSGEAFVLLPTPHQVCIVCIVLYQLVCFVLGCRVVSYSVSYRLHVQSTHNEQHAKNNANLITCMHTHKHKHTFTHTTHTPKTQMGGALHRDKTYLGKRYVEVFRCGRKDYYKAIATQVAEGYDGTAPASTASQAKTAESFPDAILKLRGLPFSATSHDIVTFFNDNNLALSRMVEIQQYVCAGWGWGVGVGGW